MKYSGSAILYLSKLRLKEDSEDIKEVSGIKITIENHKNRFAKEGKKVELLVNFISGLDKYSGIFDFALKLGVIKNPSKIYYTLPNDSKNYRKSEILKNPEKFFTKDFLDTLEIEFHKHFSYSSVLDSNDEIFDEDDSEPLVLT